MSRSSDHDGVRDDPDQRHVHGAFDIIGDVHGCADELELLLGRLGYRIVQAPDQTRTFIVTPPRGRKCVFVGDLVDRGPRSPDVLRIVMALVESGNGYAVPGNHDGKFQRWLEGRQVKVSHGLERTVAQFETESASFRADVHAFLASLPSHLWLDGGRLVIAHAGIKEHMFGDRSRSVLAFCLYGETSGQIDEFGLPVRYHWAAEYRGQPAIVYGHTPVTNPIWVNNTICIDTGCCFGGRLTALRWPERELVSVAAATVYAPSLRPFGHPPPRPPTSPSDNPRS